MAKKNKGIKTFRGRAITPGECTAEAVVSHGGFNTLASMQMMSIQTKTKCVDQNNPDLYKKILQGKALCLPQTIGSTTGGMFLYCAVKQGKNPACLLFSKEIDSLAAAGAPPARSCPKSGLRRARCPSSTTSETSSLTTSRTETPSPFTRTGPWMSRGKSPTTQRAERNAQLFFWSMHPFSSSLISKHS